MAVPELYFRQGNRCLRIAERCAACLDAFCLRLDKALARDHDIARHLEEKQKP